MVGKRVEEGRWEGERVEEEEEEERRAGGRGRPKKT